VEQGSETAIIALQYNIPTTIRMKLTSAPIVAFNESINDDTEIRRRIGDGQCWVRSSTCNSGFCVIYLLCVDVYVRFSIGMDISATGTLQEP
jgi:hypothetical protein